MNILSKRRRDEDSHAADINDPKKWKVRSKDIDYPKAIQTNTKDIDKPLAKGTKTKTKVVRNETTGLVNPQELRLALMPTFTKIDSGKGVQAKAIRKDLIAISIKLNSEQYAQPWDYIEDVWVIFETIWHTTSKTSRIYAYCTELSQIFDEEIDPIMRGLGYCCGKKYKFDAEELCCSAKELCTIPIDAEYFCYQTRWCICETCFNHIPGDSVSLDECQTTVEKDRFTKMKNISTPEPFIVCKDCTRKQHQICVLYSENIWPDGFVCESCLATKGAVRKENLFTAKNLHVTQLGSHVEKRVNDFLKNNEVNAGRIHIRILFNCNVTLEVKPKMRNLYVESGELNDAFPYRSKALFAFQEIDGVDVCFFGMYVQEYGSECPNPNTRRVYITFLDSVNFFAPKQCRTAVYHEIVLGYMDYARQLGYTMVHIWACPPPAGENYIFYNHPREQKIPNEKRLQKWYKEMFVKGMSETIIKNYKDVWQQAKADKITSAAELPYFDDDFWPLFLEESVKELEEQREQADDVVNHLFQSFHPNHNKKTKTAHKTNKVSRASRKNNNKSSQVKTDLKSKLFATMKKYRVAFFVVTLQSPSSGVTLAPIQDPDSIMPCYLMNGLDAFFNFARDRRYEFSSLRRAQFSTLSILYELYTREPYTFVYNCNNCDNVITLRYHCRVCDDYDLCVACKEQIGHVHEMDRIDGHDIRVSPSHVQQASEDADNGTVPSAGTNVDNRDRQQYIEDHNQALLHAYLCPDTFCTIVQLCHKMKSALRHQKVCTARNDACRICWLVKAIFWNHTKACQNLNCPYAFCSSIKMKLQQQQQLHRQKQHDLKALAGTLLMEASLIVMKNLNNHDGQTVSHVRGKIEHALLLLQEAESNHNGHAAKQVNNVLPAQSTVQDQSSNTQPVDSGKLSNASTTN